MGLFKSGGNFELIKEPYALIFAPHTLSIYSHMTKYGFFKLSYRVIPKNSHFHPTPLIFPRQSNESIRTGETYLVENNGVIHSS